MNKNYWKNKKDSLQRTVEEVEFHCFNSDSAYDKHYQNNLLILKELAKMLEENKLFYKIAITHHEYYGTWCTFVKKKLKKSYLKQLIIEDIKKKLKKDE